MNRALHRVNKKAQLMAAQAAWAPAQAAYQVPASATPAPENLYQQYPMAELNGTGTPKTKAPTLSSFTPVQSSTQSPLRPPAAELAPNLPAVPHPIHEIGSCPKQRLAIKDETDESISRQMVEIQAQLQLAASLRTNHHVGHAIVELFTPRNIRRTATAIIIMQIIIFSGALAIQNHQSLLYANLGFTDKQALLVSGYYGIMGIVGQIINLLFVSDR
ncbi:hypothetical protein Sste5346_004549 [Sporothrix stenoceras]|uniref:Uncharacterized protein n=1 Tax=Sporothrix stenoceras TaxID=5173 RepID=A0ABR3Z786_9PEZI